MHLYLRLVGFMHQPRQGGYREHTISIVAKYSVSRCISHKYMQLPLFSCLLLQTIKCPIIMLLHMFILTPTSHTSSDAFIKHFQFFSRWKTYSEYRKTLYNVTPCAPKTMP